MKKRILSVVLVICLVLTLVPIMVFAETSGTTDDGFSYTISDAGEVTITQYIGSATDVKIPAEIEGYNVTAIGDDAFAYCEDVTGVTIPDSVTTIGESAFFYCTNITSVTIGENSQLTSIGSEAFNVCSSLESITIPEKVIVIGEIAFNNCITMKSIYVDENNSNYSSAEGVLFDRNKTQLIKYPQGKTDTSYSIPKGVTSIWTYAFCGCTSLENVEVPDSVTSFGRAAFFACESLTSVNFGKNPQITSIAAELFKSCTSLKSITIPDGVTSIGHYAFKECTSLESVIIPNGVQTIEEETFYRCTSLKSVDIPSSVQTIEWSAFSNCTSLESVIIPSSVQTIEWSAFSNCTSLEIVIIPSSVQTIEGSAFFNCTSLKSITIPDGVTSIGHYAFNECTSLESVDIPDSVKSIGREAFSTCTSLTSIFLPDTQDLTIGADAIPNTTTQVKYSLDKTAKEVTITEIKLGTDKISVDILATICGYDVVAVKESEQPKVGAHTCVGGTATCNQKALCSLCGKEYGELEGDNHTGTKVWSKTETQHKQYWVCCDAVVVDYEDHTWNDGVCSECDYTCTHKDVSPIDHNCDICGLKVSECKDENSDHICEICEVKFTECEDDNKDGYCDICGIIVDEYLVNPCRDAEISVLEAQTVKYCSAVTIKATATAVPTGYYLAIYIDGNQVAIAEGQGNSTTEVSYNVEKLKNDIDYTVKVVDEDGNVQKNADGVELSKDGGKITCKKNCIIRLLEILRNLIKNILRVVVNILKFIISLL